MRQENTGADGKPLVTEVVYRWATAEELSEPALTDDDDEPRRLQGG